MLAKRVQLLSPHFFSENYVAVKEAADSVIVRPKYLAICHADQRYYQGKRHADILRKKLPMALIHECSATVLKDPQGRFAVGEPVALIPNIPDPQNTGYYENYGNNIRFRSSGYDGFMQELLALPADRVVSLGKVNHHTAAITEFFSVSFHAIRRLRELVTEVKNIALWGDGSLAYVTCVALRYLFPQAHITLIGKNQIKTNMFTFVDQVHFVEEIPADFRCDHAIECCGGEGSYFAIDDIIRYIRPEGKVVLMGVSENKIAINTRDILEKGLTFFGSSRSGRDEFVNAVEAMNDRSVQQRLSRIIHAAGAVNDIDDLHRVFAQDMLNPFKTVFEWNL